MSTEVNKLDASHERIPTLKESKMEEGEREEREHRKLTLEQLLREGVLESGDGVLSMEYMGMRFTGDLLPDGSIRWGESGEIFPSPSAWAIHCKRATQPDKKTSCGWSQVKYKGRKLELYKQEWLHKHQTAKKASFNPIKINKDEPTNRSLEAFTRVGKTVIRKPSWFLNNKRQLLGISNEGDDEKENCELDGNKIAAGETAHKTPANPQYAPVTFAAVERLQPFHVSVTSNVLLLVDFHCHLTDTEVCGYLGGSWDVATHAMSVTQAFPLKTSLDSNDPKAMEEIQSIMSSRGISPVGWYHSHPKLSVHPTKKDIQNQLDYQLAMRGDNEAQYMPVIGLVCAPQGSAETPSEADMLAFWVMPPPENRPQEVGKAMKMVYANQQDNFLTQDLLMEMRVLAEYYRTRKKLTDFTAQSVVSSTLTHWDQLKTSLGTKLPRDLQTSASPMPATTSAGVSQDTAAQAVQHFWEFVRGLIVPIPTATVPILPAQQPGTSRD